MPGMTEVWSLQNRNISGPLVRLTQDPRQTSGTGGEIDGCELLRRSPSRML